MTNKGNGSNKYLFLHNVTNPKENDQKTKTTISLRPSKTSCKPNIYLTNVKIHNSSLTFLQDLPLHVSVTLQISEQIAQNDHHKPSYC